MSPEIILAGYESAAADVFAAGVICYILLSGHPPFATKSIRESFMRTVSGAYKLEGHEWDVISAEAKDLIRRMLDPNPHTRITTQQILQHPWIAQLAEEEDVDTAAAAAAADAADTTAAAATAAGGVTTASDAVPTDASTASTVDMGRGVTRVPTSVPSAEAAVHAADTVSALRSASTSTGRSVRSRRNTMNLHRPDGSLATHVQMMRTEKIARTVTRLMSATSSAGRHSRLADVFLVRAQPPAAPADALDAAQRGAEAQEDAFDEQQPVDHNHAMYHTLFNDVKQSHKALAAIIRNFGGDSKGRISIAQFALLHQQLSQNRMMKNAPSSVRRANAFGPWGYGGINMLKFVDRDRDGFITPEDIFTAHAMIMQRSEEFLRALFGVYVDAVFYPGCKANFVLALRTLQRQTADGPAAETPSAGAADAEVDAAVFTGVKEQMRAIYKQDPDAPDEEDESQYFVPPEKLHAEYVIEPPKFITGKHVARIFERTGFRAEDGYKVFEILCDALSRIAAHHGDGGGGDMDEGSCHDASSSDTAAASVEGLNIRDSESSAHSAGAATAAAGGGKFVRTKRQMDVQDFLSACQIDDVLVQVLTRNTSEQWVNLIHKTKSELQMSTTNDNSSSSSGGGSSGNSSAI